MSRRTSRQTNRPATNDGAPDPAPSGGSHRPTENRGPAATTLSVREIGAGLFDRSLPHALWTHEAHLAAAVYVLKLKPEWDAHTVMPLAIRGYNEHHGVPNTDHGGFHATITEFYLRVIADFLDGLNPDHDADDAFRALLESPLADRKFPLLFYDPRRLFSVEARRHWVEPDFLSVSRHHLSNSG